MMSEMLKKWGAQLNLEIAKNSTNDNIVSSSVNPKLFCASFLAYLELKRLPFD